MKIFKEALQKFTLKRRAESGVSNKMIETASGRVFREYQKTFKDLARYDRGEKIFGN